MGKIDVLLDRVDRLRKTGDGKWLACCPAHGDKSPSLAIRETDGGTVLLHCFAGCSVDSVLSSIGLEMSDLFPDKTGREWDANATRPKPPKFRSSDFLELAAFESRVVALALFDSVNKKTVSESDLDRVVLAANILTAISTELGHA